MEDFISGEPRWIFQSGHGSIWQPWHSWQESIPFSPSAPAPEARPPWAKPTAGLQPPVLGEARSILSIFSSSFVYCGMLELLFDIDIIYDIWYHHLHVLFHSMCRLCKGQWYCLRHRHHWKKTTMRTIFSQAMAAIAPNGGCFAWVASLELGECSVWSHI